MRIGRKLAAAGNATSPGLLAALFSGWFACLATAADSRPNILFCLSDDQSWPHASAYGEPVIETPVFDRVAQQGALFTQAYRASP